MPQSSPPTLPASAVFVALYELSPYDHERLDHWESADTGVYNQIHVRVSTLDGDVLAMVYVLDAYEGGLPSARYLGLIAEAAEKARRAGRVHRGAASSSVPLAREP